MSAETEWVSDDDQELWRAWQEAHAQLDLAVQRDLRLARLSHPDFIVLVQLTDQPSGALRLGELARLARWDRSRTSHQVTRMEGRGLVRRGRVDDDRRGALVEITPAGRRAIEAASPSHVATVRSVFLDRLDRQDRRDLRRILDRLRSEPDASGGSDRPVGA
ncbi:MAG: MarR family winged helix-turn-helix transcriptional regulator [Micrococcales bacterium]|nr:MarR family winged helix-turn-helix transcriptional regulator [Micrococcales bacterium]